MWHELDPFNYILYLAHPENMVLQIEFIDNPRNNFHPFWELFVADLDGEPIFLTNNTVANFLEVNYHSLQHAQTAGQELVKRMKWQILQEL